MSWAGSTLDFLKEQAQRQRAEQARQSQEEKDHHYRPREHRKISTSLFPEPPRQKAPSDDDSKIEKVLGDHGQVKQFFNSLVGISQAQGPGTPQITKEAFTFNATEDVKPQLNGKVKKQPSSRRSLEDKSRNQGVSGDHKKESGDHKKESVDHRKESVDHRKESGDHRKESGDHRKESGDHRKESGDHRKESGDHRKESGDHKKELGGEKVQLNNGASKNDKYRSSSVKDSNPRVSPSPSKLSSKSGTVQEKPKQPSSSSMQKINHETSPVRKPHKPVTTTSKPPAEKPTTPTKMPNTKPSTPQKTTPQKTATTPLKNQLNANLKTDDTFNKPIQKSVKFERPNLQVKIENNGSDGTPRDVDDILKEMTVVQPITAILTPRKDDQKITFPMGNHVSQIFNKKPEPANVKVEKIEKIENTVPEIKANDDSHSKPLTRRKSLPNGNTDDLLDDLRVSDPEDSDSEKVPDIPIITTQAVSSRPGPTTITGGVGGKAPFKEQKSSMSSDSESSSSSSESDDEGSDSGSEDSDEESHDSDDGQVEDQKKEAEKHLKTPPIKSPPPTQEQEKKSWAISAFINSTAPPLSTNPSIHTRRSSGSPFSDDPNNDLIEDLIQNIRSTEPESKDEDEDDDIPHHDNHFQMDIGSDCSPISAPSVVKHPGKSPVTQQTSFGWSHDSSISKNQVSSKQQTGKNNRTTRVPKKEINDKGSKKTTQPRARKSSCQISSDSDSDSDHEDNFNGKVDEEEVDEIDVENWTPEKSHPSFTDVKEKDKVSTRLEFPEKESSVKDNCPAVKESKGHKHCESKPTKYSRSRSKDKPNERKKMKCKDKVAKEHKIYDNPPIAVVAPMTMTKELNTSNSSIDKDMREIMQEIGTSDSLLSPIPNAPEKPKINFERLDRLAPSPEKPKDCNSKTMPNYKGLSYKDGKPCIMVHLDKSLVSQLIKETRKKSNCIVKPSNNKKRKMTDGGVVAATDSKREVVDSGNVDDIVLTPESKLDPSFSSQQSTVSHINRKSTKRKQETERHEGGKRQKGSHKSSHKKSSEISQKEKTSHTDDHEWDRKHPQRSRSNSKERHLNSSSHHSNKHTTSQPSASVEDLSKSDSDEKEDQLSVVPQNGETHPASVETYNREGDSDIQPRNLENRLEPADVYLSRGKELKHDADNLSDKLAKSLMYTEAVLCFIQCGYAMEKDAISEVNKIFTMYRDTYKLITNICRFRSTTDTSLSEKEKKLAVLSFRIQSLLCLKLFKLKKTETMKFKRAIDDHNKTTSSKPPPAPTHAPSPHQNSWNRSTGTPSPMSPTPSPSGSIGSVGSQGSCNDLTPSKMSNSSMASPGTVAIPQRIHSVTQQYLNTVSYLVQCHDFWDQADQAIQDFTSQRKPCKEFFDELDEHCGTLSLHSSISDLVHYAQTGLQRLKDT